MAQDTESEEGAEKRKVTPAQWHARIDNAKEQFRSSWDMGKMAFEEYLGPQMKYDSYSGKFEGGAARYPIYWSSIKTLQTMLYSRTPIPVAEKNFDDLDDNIARVGCLSLERLAKYLMRSCAFDSTMSYARDTYINYGKATTRIYFESEINEQAEKVYYTQVQVPAPPDPNQQAMPQDPNMPPMPPQPPPMQNIWVDSRGEQVQDPSLLQQDEQGFYIEMPGLDTVCVDVCPVHYRDNLHNPNARWQEEITWKAYKSALNRSQFRAKFGSVEGIVFSVPGEENSTQTSSGKTKSEPTANIWECWDKETNKLSWIAEGKKDAFLTPLQSDGQPYEGDDPYELDGFFPSPDYILGTVGPDSIIPVPDYIQLKPFIDQIHGLAERLQIHVRALKTQGIYDAGIPGLKEAIEGLGSGQFAALQNFQELVDEGGRTGLEKLIRFFPMKEIAEVVQLLMQVIQDYEAKFLEVWGIPDIVRGADNPEEGYQKQQQKGEWMSLRATVPGRAFQGMVRQSIELMCDLALKMFPKRKLEDVIGVQYMPEEDQAVWPQVLLLLQDDDERKIRIDIQTDSTITMNENVELEQRNYVAKIVTEGFSSIATATAQDPDFAPAALQALIDVVAGTQKGKSIEGMLRALQKKKLEQMENPAPPPPDPKIQVEQMKQEGKMRELQAKSQLDQSKQAGDFQIQQAKAESEMMIEQIQAEADIQTTMAKIQAEVQQSQLEGSAKMQLEEMLAGLKAQLEILKAGLKVKEQNQQMQMKKQETALSAGLEVWNTQEAIKLTKEQAKHSYEGKDKK